MKSLTIPLALAASRRRHRPRRSMRMGQRAPATKAAAILAKKPKVIEFCEPCGDKVPGSPFVPTTIERAAVGDGYQAVSIDGHSRDLAYTYVKTSDDHYENLAVLAGCPAEGVSPRLTIEAETPNGVMITADDHDVPLVEQPPVDLAIAAVAMPEPPPPPGPQTIVYSTTYTQSISWLAVAVAGVGGVFAGAMTMLGAIAMRRRRAMKPRATDL